MIDGFVCGPVSYPVELPDAGNGVCCLEALEDGPQGCTCWVAVYDQEQAPLLGAEAGDTHSEPRAGTALDLGSGGAVSGTPRDRTRAIPRAAGAAAARGAQPPLPLPPVPCVLCADCAYRPDSPERSGDETYQGAGEELDRIVQAGEPFYCHQGIRRVVALRHPSGVEVPSHPGDYQPPIVRGFPWKADGTPASICVGWLIRRAAAQRKADSGG